MKCTISPVLRFNLLLLVVALGQGNAFAQRKATANRPNIVIIMADDLGYNDFSCQGAEKIHTPIVDALAAEGMRFSDAHTASSLCSPSRYSFLTGRYSWRTRLKSGVLTWFARPLIEPGRTTLASLLKRNGYETACIGKWHLGFDWALKPNAPADPDKEVFDSWEVSTQDYIDFSKPVKSGPIERGFDYFYGISASNNMIPFVFIENDRVVQPPSVEKEYVYDTDQKSTRAPNWNLETLDQDLTAKAVDVIDRHFRKNKQKPLFLYYPTAAIHRPCLPSFTKGKSQAGLRGDMALTFDWIVGQVVEALKRNHALDNTLLIVTSDNGGVPGDAVAALDAYREAFGDKYHQDYFDAFQPEYSRPQGNDTQRKGWLTYGHPSSGPFLGFKSDAWEGGHRVPLIIRWPGKVKQGQVNNTTVCNTDLLATLCDLMGEKLTSGEGEDSYSYLDNLLGKSTGPIRHTMTLTAGGSGAFVVRKGDWVFIQSGKPAWGQTYYANGPSTHDPQLYNLKEDPGEQHNLFKQLPDKVAELREVIQNTKKQPGSEGIKQLNDN